MLPPPPYTMLYPYGGLCTLFCVYNVAMDIEEIERRHKEVIAVLKLEINRKNAEMRELDTKYKEIKKAAMAIGSAGAIINHLERELEHANMIISAYQDHYEKYGKVYDKFEKNHLHIVRKGHL